MERMATPTATQPAPRPVRGADNASALSRVKRLYGPDALILGTRRVRGDDGEWEVEVLVAGVGGAPALPAASLAASASAGEAPAADTAVAGRVGADELDLPARVERLLARVSHLGEQLAAEPAPHPLLDRVSAAGCGEPGRRALEAELTGGSGTEEALLRSLPCLLPRGARSLAGEHWICGRPGSGKSTAAARLAQQALAAGLRVGLVAVAPRHAGEAQALEDSAGVLGIPGLAVFDEEDMARAREALAGCDVLVVDSPCWRARPLPVAPPEGATVHLAVPVGDDPQLSAGLLATAGAPVVNAILPTQFDLLPRPGRLLDLVALSGRPLSLLTEQAGGRIRARFCRPVELLGQLLDAAAGGA